MSDWFQVPAVSTATGKKMREALVLLLLLLFDAFQLADTTMIKLQITGRNIL